MEESTPNETKASLRVHSANLSPGDITKALGQTPTTIGEKDALMSPLNPASHRRETSLWLLESDLPHSVELEDHISHLVTFAENHSVEFSKIAADCEIDIFCGFFSHQSQGHFYLDVKLMKSLVALNAELIFDIYGTYEKD
jgi:hypothetical protein